SSVKPNASTNRAEGAFGASTAAATAPSLSRSNAHVSKTSITSRSNPWRCRSGWMAITGGPRDQEALAARRPKAIRPAGKVAPGKRGARHVLGVLEAPVVRERQHVRRRELGGEGCPGCCRAFLCPLERAAVLG